MVRIRGIVKYGNVPSTDVAKGVVKGEVPGRDCNTGAGGAAGGRDIADLSPQQRVGGAADDSAAERASAVPATCPPPRPLPQSPPPAPLQMTIGHRSTSVWPRRPASLPPGCCPALRLLVDRLASSSSWRQRRWRPCQCHHLHRRRRWWRWPSKKENPSLG